LPRRSHSAMSISALAARQSRTSSIFAMRAR
jgi:hypothetical protein